MSDLMANSAIPRGGATLAGGPRVDRPQSEVEQEFSSIGSSLMELDSVISELHRRLEPVLGPELPEGGNKPGLEHPIRSSALAQQLQTTDNEIRHKMRRVVNLITRLTV